METKPVLTEPLVSRLGRAHEAAAFGLYGDCTSPLDALETVEGITNSPSVAGKSPVDRLTARILSPECPAELRADAVQVTAGQLRGATDAAEYESSAADLLFPTLSSVYSWAEQAALLLIEDATIGGEEEHQAAVDALLARYGA